MQLQALNFFSLTASARNKFNVFLILIGNFNKQLFLGALISFIKYMYTPSFLHQCLHSTSLVSSLQLSIGKYY